jgi:acetyl esterase/lipase
MRRWRARHPGSCGWASLGIGIVLLLVLPTIPHVWQGATSTMIEEKTDSREILRRPPPPADRRLPYGKAPQQFGDLRLPKGPAGVAFPVVVVLHGGCWLAEYGHEYMGHLSADLTAGGVATWTLEYRRLGEEGGGWPGTFDDIADGIDHLRQLARDYPLDLGRVVVTGHSAGGHLALWAGGRGRLSTGSPLHRPNPLPLAGLVPIAGLTDLTLPGTACDAELPRIRGPLESLTETSPRAMLPLGVPVTLIQGEADTAVPALQATSYATAAAAKGDRPQLVLLPDADHFVVVDPTSSVWPRIRAEILGMVAKDPASSTQAPERSSLQ